MATLLAAATLAFFGPPAHAEDKLVDGFGVDQLLDGGFVTRADMLAGSRDLLALAPDAVRVDSGPLVVDTRTPRSVVRYAPAQPGAFELDALRVAALVPGPASAVLWLAGLGALAAIPRRATRLRGTAGACILASCAAGVAGCDAQVNTLVRNLPEPATCTAEQWRAILDQANAGLEAEARGSSAAFLATMRSWRSAPPACQPLVARLQPVAANCTAAEAQVLVQWGPSMQAAAARGDLRGIVSIYDRTAAAVTPACWRAANQHSHPRVVEACSPAELEGLSAQAPAIQRRVLVAAATLDLPAAFALADQVARLTNALAPACQAAILGVMPSLAQGGRGMPSAGAGLPGVLTHGNGTLSVPGLAYCGPSGCVLM